MMRGDLNQMSFAFTILRDEWKYDSDKDERTILEVKQLYDVSLVTYPFYSETSAALRSLERWKAENGKDEEEEQRIQKELITLEHRIRHNFLFTKL
jgi:phage head maturation protease